MRLAWPPHESNQNCTGLGGPQIDSKVQWFQYVKLTEEALFVRWFESLRTAALYI